MSAPPKQPRWAAAPAAPSLSEASRTNPHAEADANDAATRHYARDARVYYVAEETSFFGERRTYAGHRVLDEADTARGQESRRRAGRRDAAADHVARSDTFGEWHDAYQDAGYTAMMIDPDERAQVERDMRDERFHAGVEEARVRGHEEARRRVVAEHEAAAAASTREQRMRAEVARALDAAARNRSLLSLDYLRGVPRSLAESFVATAEVQAIIRTIVPQLYVPSARRTHVTRHALVAAMGSPGGLEFKSAERRTLVGHALDHAPPGADGRQSSLYAPRDDEHWHYDAATNTSVLDVLTFRCVNVFIDDVRAGDGFNHELAALAATATPLVGRPVEPQSEDARIVEAAAAAIARERPCYLIDVVAHVVAGSPETLCLRCCAFRT